MKKNVIISSVLVIALCLSVIAGSTFALFTSESTVNASVSSGKVSVVATVDTLILGSTLGENLPETSATYYPDTNVITVEKFVPGDYVTFNINVSNESDVTVNYRTKISVVDDNGLWDGLEVTIGDTVYDGAAKISSWSTLLPGSADIVVPVKVALPEDSGNEYQNKTCSFAYTVEAIQGNFDVTTIPNNESSFNDILEDGGDVFLLTDLTTTETVSAYSGVAAVTMTNGGYINGNGNTLTVTNANSTWDCAIYTQGGTIENLTVNGSFRGIMVGDSLGGDLILNNVVIDKVCYTFHADGTKEQANGYKVVINNSVLNGWTSYSPNVSVVEFNNCSFGKGTGGYTYAYMRPYAPTVLTNCTFSEGFEIDARNNITLTNCYYGDTLITAENISSLGLIVDGADKVTVIDYTVKDGVYTAVTNTGIDQAIKAGANTVELGSGSYIIPDSAKGKTITIKGNGVDTVVATQDDGSYEGCDYSLDGANVVFEGITINTDSATYTGYARLSATYNNCTINGAYTLYGNSEFNNCTFNVTGDTYNIWTWGANEVKFNNCTFNTDGKSLLVYNQSCDVYISGCTFNDRTNGTNFTKSAIETGVDAVGAATYNIYITNTKVNGFAKNDKCVGYENVVGNKNSISGEYLNIVVDEVDVY